MLDQSNQHGPSEPAQIAPATSTTDGRSLPPLINGAPDWPRVDYDVHCSRCGYNLRTLTRPLCPECGLTFEWQHVLDRRQWGSAFLFEYQWHKRPVRSWFRTVWRSFRPGRFWREDVSLHSEVHIGPLLFMLGSSVIASLVAIQVLSLLGWLVTYALYEATPVGAGRPPSSNPMFFAVAMFEALSFVPVRAPVDYLTLLLFVLLYPVFMLSALCSLRQTLARCRVQTSHMIRVVAYNATPCMIVLAVIAFAVFVGTELDAPFSGPSMNKILVELLAIMVIIPTVVFGLFTRRGLREYLEIPRAATVGFVCAFVASLAVFTIAFTWMIQM